ncbi:MAG: hypothetical protein DLM54_05795 [Acidimicrobiales bacterium]|nr:MAG: hypothetical protein DLM54_05795 [Acidimicrobiales bacterium]
MPKRIVAMVASVVAAMAGGWLIVAPFALAYRPKGGSWDHTTEVDVWTGVGVVVVALVCLAATSVATVADLRARGALPGVSRRAGRKARRVEQSRAVSAEEGQTGGPEEGRPLGEVAIRTAVPPDGSTAPGVAAVANPEPDLRHLLASLVQALVDDTGHTDDRPMSVTHSDAHPADASSSHAGPVGEDDAAGRIGHSRWKKTS